MDVFGGMCLTLDVSSAQDAEVTESEDLTSPRKEPDGGV